MSPINLANSLGITLNGRQSQEEPTSGPSVAQLSPKPDTSDNKPVVFDKGTIGNDLRTTIPELLSKAWIAGNRGEYQSVVDIHNQLMNYADNNRDGLMRAARYNGDNEQRKALAASAKSLLEGTYFTDVDEKTGLSLSALSEPTSDQAVERLKSLSRNYGGSSQLKLLSENPKASMTYAMVDAWINKNGEGSRRGLYLSGAIDPGSGLLGNHLLGSLGTINSLAASVDDGGVGDSNASVVFSCIAPVARTAEQFNDLASVSQTVGSILSKDPNSASKGAREVSRLFSLYREAAVIATNGAPRVDNKEGNPLPIRTQEIDALSALIKSVSSVYKDYDKSGVDPTAFSKFANAAIQSGLANDLVEAENSGIYKYMSDEEKAEEQKRITLERLVEIFPRSSLTPPSTPSRWNVSNKASSIIRNASVGKLAETRDELGEDGKVVSKTIPTMRDLDNANNINYGAALSLTQNISDALERSLLPLAAKGRVGDENVLARQALSDSSSINYAAGILKKSFMSRGSTINDEQARFFVQTFADMTRDAMDKNESLDVNDFYTAVTTTREVDVKTGLPNDLLPIAESAYTAYKKLDNGEKLTDSEYNDAAAFICARRPTLNLGSEIVPFVSPAEKAVTYQSSIASALKGSVALGNMITVASNGMFNADNYADSLKGVPISQISKNHFGALKEAYGDDATDYVVRTIKNKANNYIKLATDQGKELDEDTAKALATDDVLSGLYTNLAVKDIKEKGVILDQFEKNLDTSLNIVLANVSGVKDNADLSRLRDLINLSVGSYKRWRSQVIDNATVADNDPRSQVTRSLGLFDGSQKSVYDTINAFLTIVSAKDPEVAVDLKRALTESIDGKDAANYAAMADALSTVVFNRALDDMTIARIRANVETSVANERIRGQRNVTSAFVQTAGLLASVQTALGKSLATSPKWWLGGKSIGLGVSKKISELSKLQRGLIVGVGLTGMTSGYITGDKSLIKSYSSVPYLFNAGDTLMDPDAITSGDWYSGPGGTNSATPANLLGDSNLRSRVKEQTPGFWDVAPDAAAAAMVGIKTGNKYAALALPAFVIGAEVISPIFLLAGIEDSEKERMTAAMADSLTSIASRAESFGFSQEEARALRSDLAKVLEETKGMDNEDVKLRKLHDFWTGRIDYLRGTAAAYGKMNFEGAVATATKGLDDERNRRFQEASLIMNGANSTVNMKGRCGSSTEANANRRALSTVFSSKYTDKLNQIAQSAANAALSKYSLKGNDIITTEAVNKAMEIAVPLFRDYSEGKTVDNRIYEQVFTGVSDWVEKSMDARIGRDISAKVALMQAKEAISKANSNGSGISPGEHGKLLQTLARLEEAVQNGTLSEDDLNEYKQILKMNGVPLSAQ